MTGAKSTMLVIRAVSTRQADYEVHQTQVEQYFSHLAGVFGWPFSTIVDDHAIQDTGGWHQPKIFDDKK